MNAIFITEGNSVLLFHKLARDLKREMNLENTGFYVTKAIVYQYLSRVMPNIDKKFKFLKEWEIINKALKNNFKLDNDILKKFEDEIGDPWLWNPIILDRRLIHGVKVKLTQDYPPRYNYEQLRKIVQLASMEIDNFIDSSKPDIIISFVPATFGSYLFYLFARARGIKYLQLKSTKILNYVTLYEGIYENYKHIYKIFNSGKVNNVYIDKAKNYIDKFSKERIFYEGVKKIKQRDFSEKIRKLLRFIRFSFYSQSKLVRSDSSNRPGLVINHLYIRFINPIRFRFFRFLYRKRFIKKERLDVEDYSYFPLHTEPEIAISLYGRPFRNQIEVIRNIAQNLPINMRLFVKEHPRSFGMRKLEYYERLLEIPNVALVDPLIDSLEVSRKAKLVIVITGFTGLEAAIQKKPVITLGYCNFNILSMVKNVDNLHELGFVIKEALDNYKYDGDELVRFIAAMMQGSVAINLYSKFLKTNVERINYELDKSADYMSFKEYSKKRINSVLGYDGYN